MSSAARRRNKRKRERECGEEPTSIAAIDDAAPSASNLTKQSANNQQQQQNDTNSVTAVPQTKNASNKTNKRRNQTASITEPAPRASPAAAMTPRALLLARLEASRFRQLNELLYTSTSQAAVDFFASHPLDFAIYHRGFARQADKWPSQPLDLIIQWLLTGRCASKANAAKTTIVDLGCGEARLAVTLKAQGCTVHSFDLVSANDHVVACNIARTPLASGTCHVAVLCLALMGSDWLQFIREAHRLLSAQSGSNSQLCIAEVQSRFQQQGAKAFTQQIEQCGFKLQRQQNCQTHFTIFWFQRIETSELEAVALQQSSNGKQKGKTLSTHASQTLQPCIYKRR